MLQHEISLNARIHADDACTVQVPDMTFGFQLHLANKVACRTTSTTSSS